MNFSVTTSDPLIIIMMKRLITSILICALTGTPVSAQYYLGVVQGESKKIPIAVLDVYDDIGSSALRALALNVLQDDLRRSQIFDVMDPKKLDVVYEGKTEPAGYVIKRCGTFGLTGVAWVKLQRKDKDLVLQGMLFDAASGMRISNKEYFGNEETFRRMVHAFADEIVFRYTGERGIAQTRIAYVSDKTRFKELYVMDYDGQNPMRITADRSICLSPAWSPNGKVLAYVSYRDKNPDLYGLDMDTGKRWKISGSEGLNISPAWSPNGNRLALALTKDNGTEIYTMSQNGNDLERLTYGAFDNVSPAWAPNGREIAFTSGRAGTPQVYIMGSDGTDVRRITFEGSYNASPNWSSRGDRIVFVTLLQGLFKIATVNPDGSDYRILTSGPGSDENPCWSASGRQILFSSNREGKSNLYIMNSDGSDIERITPNDANYTSPAWSP
jgi:TolB protein